jgi:precorrin-4 methylase
MRANLQGSSHLGAQKTCDITLQNITKQIVMEKIQRTCLASSKHLQNTCKTSNIYSELNNNKVGKAKAT